MLFSNKYAIMNDLLNILKEWIPLIKDIVIIGTAIITGYVGLKGLGTWRRQLKVNTEYKLAKQLLISVYEIREIITSIRNPFILYSKELDMPKEKLQKLSQKEKNWQSKAQAFQK